MSYKVAGEGKKVHFKYKLKEDKLNKYFLKIKSFQVPEISN